MNINLEEWMSVPDAAKELGMGLVSVHNQIRYHQTLESVKIGTGRMVRREDVAALKAKLEAERAESQAVAA